MQTDWLLELNSLLMMIPGGGFVYSALIFILVLSILVFVHEWGHYKAARSVGITVEEFSIGFGTALAKWRDSNGTNWKIGLIPLGGYVQMKGQEDGKLVQATGEDDNFADKKIWQRAWVIAAGPLMNIVLAIVVLTALMLWGERRLAPEIGMLLPNKPAEEAGVMVGDVVRLVNATAIEDWADVQEAIRAHRDGPLEMTVDRNGLLVPILITPEMTKVTDLLGDEHVYPQVGISPVLDKTFTTSHPPLYALQRGLERTWELTELTFRSLYKLVIGAVSPEHIAGPLGIADLTSKAGSQGTYELLVFLAIISINLAIFNLLPVPVLDGGHLLFLLYEALVGKPVGEAAQLWSLRIGLGLILCLVVFATANDLRRLNPLGVFGDAALEEPNVAK